MQKLNSLLIVGIDPGTTVAYAVLDINGNILKINSAKEISLSSLISEVIKHGKPVITGCDVSPAPSFVEKFATKTGSKLIDPEADLLKKEKQELVKGIKTRNIHESDALSSALYAFKTIKPLLSKTDRILEKLNKEKISEQVKEQVIKNNIAIKTAIDIIEKPEETRIIKKVIEKKILLERDFIRLYERSIKSEKDTKLLKHQNKRLAQEADSKGRKFNLMVNKLAKYVPRSKLKQSTYEKQKEINMLKQQNQGKELEIKILKNKIDNLNNIILNTANNTISKKLNALSIEEINKTQIKKGDILFVNDLTHFSEKAINDLKDKISIIVYKKSNKIKLPFTLIPAKNLNIKETDKLAIISNTSLKKELAKKDILTKVIEEFKEERST